MPKYLLVFTSTDAFQYEIEADTADEALNKYEEAEDPEKDFRFEESFGDLELSAIHKISN